MPYLRLIAITVLLIYLLQHFDLWFMRGGIICKLIWYSSISIIKVCFKNTLSKSVSSWKYSSNDHAEKTLQCLLITRIRLYVIVNFFFLVFREVITVVAAYIWLIFETSIIITLISFLQLKCKCTRPQAPIHVSPCVYVVAIDAS